MTTLMRNRKSQAVNYPLAAFDLFTKNGNFDDYDIRKCTGNEFEEIANLKLPILTFVEYLIAEYNPHCMEIDEDSCSVILTDANGMKTGEFCFILTPILSFSGTIGINQVDYDCGVSKHIDYLSLFFPPSELYRLKMFTIPFTVTEEKDILDEYIGFYKLLGEYLQRSPMALYNLLTGIKKHYGLLDNAVLLTTDGFSLLDFSKFKNIDFINNYDDVEIEASDTSPLLKISYQGRKLLHLRTKSDKKNSKFKLRMFIETSSKFLDLFKKGN